MDDNSHHNHEMPQPMDNQNNEHEEPKMSDHDHHNHHDHQMDHSKNNHQEHGADTMRGSINGEGILRFQVNKTGNLRSAPINICIIGDKSKIGTIKIRDMKNLLL